MQIGDLIDRLLQFDLQDEVEGYAMKVFSSEEVSGHGLPDGEGFEIQEIIVTKCSAVGRSELFGNEPLKKVLIYGGAWPSKPAVLGHSCSHCGTFVKGSQLCHVCGQDPIDPSS